MTTYEDVIKIKRVMEEAKASYKRAYVEYLSDILKTLGMYEKPVYCKQLEVRGMIKIVPTGFGEQPFNFAFFPFKKDGTLSRNQRCVNNCLSKFCFVDPLKESKYEQILEALKENFSVIKEENQ